MSNNNNIEMMRLRKKGMPLKEIAKKFGVTHQAVCFRIGPTNHLFMKKFKLNCDHCGKSLDYISTKRRKKEKKYCDNQCYYLGKRILDIPAERGTKEFSRLKGKLMYARNPEARKKITMRYYNKNRDAIIEKMKIYNEKRKLV